MLALRKKIVKIFEIHSWDVRYSSGELIFSRSNHKKNCLIYEGHNIISKSSTAKTKRPFWLSSLIKKIKPLMCEINYFKIVVTNNKHVLHLAMKDKSSVKEWEYLSLYLEIKLGESTFSQEFPLEMRDNDKDAFLQSIREWIARQRKFLSLPLSPIKKVHKILFSAGSVGFILHELVGHRLESDDFSVLPSLNGKTTTNYRVYDSPGIEGKPGYTPYGDDGSLGKSVKLFDGQKMEYQFLKESTGNLRATSADFHPIIRQRTLITKVIKEKSKASFNVIKRQPYLEILNISEGELDSRGNKMNCKLVVDQARYFDGKGNVFRVPPFELSLTERDILKLNLFGKPQFYVPGGGCHKGVQRGLSVAFYSHSALLNLNTRI